MTDFYENDEDLADVLAAFERGVQRLTEPLRRELAQRHKDDLWEDTAVPVKTPKKRLDSIHSVRFSSDEAAELQKAADRLGLAGLSSLLRIAARYMIEPVGFRCEHMSLSCGSGFVSFTGYCGCEMQPVYRVPAGVAS